ncbi:MAG: pyridoxal-phosphate dependent enzyme [Solirubrobacteraceae bacterium]
MTSAATAFHRALPGYAPTPLRSLDGVAAELGLGAVWLKDESARLGLPAFKVLGASWAAELALRDAPGTHTLVAASAGNHGRAVAQVAALRGLRCRVFLPARSVPARRDAIAGEGAEVVVLAGTYEEACAAATAAAAQEGVLEIADVGPHATAVIDGYATLFAEIDEPVDVVLVPVGVGSLAAAAVRAHPRVIGVEPERAACLTAALAAGHPVEIDTPGTALAGMDCARVSEGAWPDLRGGIERTITVTDDETHAAMRELAALGLRFGDCGAAPLAALRRAALAPGTRALLIATEGVTDPEGYAAVLSAPGPPRARSGR